MFYFMYDIYFMYSLTCHHSTGTIDCSKRECLGIEPKNLMLGLTPQWIIMDQLY